MSLQIFFPNSATNSALDAINSNNPKYSNPFFVLINTYRLLKSFIANANLSIKNSLIVFSSIISQWLLGKKKPPYDNVLSVCKNFDITPNEFFGF